MGNCLRQPVVLSSVATKCRKFWLVAAFVPLSLGLSEPAVAQTCAPVPNGGTLTNAQPSTSCTGTFNTNINFGGPTTPLPPSLTLILAPGVTTVTSPAGGNAVNLANVTSPIFPPAGGVAATILANDATITNTSNPGGGSQSALRIQASGSATIGTAANPVSGIINIIGGQSTNAIFSTVFASVAGETASVTYTGAATPGVPDINVIAGPNSSAIQACANAGCGFSYAGTGVTPPDGNASINAAGNFTAVGGASSFGLTAVAGGNGTANVTYRGGEINLTGGAFSTGIFASGGGGATIATLLGTTVTVSSTASGAAGVEAFSGNGATLANVASTIRITGPISLRRMISGSNPPVFRSRAISGGQLRLTTSAPALRFTVGAASASLP